MKLTNFAFLPPLDDIKKELLNRLKNDFPEIEFLVFDQPLKTCLFQIL